MSSFEKNFIEGFAETLNEKAYKYGFANAMRDKCCAQCQSTRCLLYVCDECPMIKAYDAAIKRIQSGEAAKIESERSSSIQKDLRVSNVMEIKKKTGGDVKDLELSTRARNVLQKHNITGIAEIKEMSDEDFFKFRAVGKGIVLEIRNAVRKFEGKEIIEKKPTTRPYTKTVTVNYGLLTPQEREILRILLKKAEVKN